MGTPPKLGWSRGELELEFECKMKCDILVANELKNAEHLTVWLGLQ